jgi:hypothetical protein
MSPFLCAVNADQMLAAVHDELSDGDLLALCERIAEDDVTLISAVTIRQKVIGLLEIAAVDLVPINEPRHVDVLGFELRSSSSSGLMRTWWPLVCS